MMKFDLRGYWVRLYNGLNVDEEARMGDEKQ